MVTGIHLHALFVCLKHCLSEEAATKELCLFPQTVPVTFCLFEQKHYLNRLSLSQERKDYAECVQFDAGPVHELFFFAFFMNTLLYWYFYDVSEH